MVSFLKREKRFTNTCRTYLSYTSHVLVGYQVLVFCCRSRYLVFTVYYLCANFIMSCLHDTFARNAYLYLPFCLRARIHVVSNSWKDTAAAPVLKYTFYNQKRFILELCCVCMYVYIERHPPSPSIFGLTRFYKRRSLTHWEGARTPLVCAFSININSCETAIRKRQLT